MITLKACKSKLISAFGYEPQSQTLAVKFSPSSIYHYKNVPQDVYDALDSAESVGVAFAKLIRGHFDHEVVLDESETLEPSEA